MKRYRIYIATISTALMSIATSCSCSNDAKHISAATELGQKHAAMLCDTVLNSYELHYRLLSVRSREWQMRSNGFEKSADEYISAFEAYLTEHNSELADKILR